MINNYHYKFMLVDQAFQSDLTCKTCIQSSTVMSQSAMQFTLYINRRRVKIRRRFHFYRSQIAVFYPEIILMAINQQITKNIPSSHQSGCEGKFNLQF